MTRKLLEGRTAIVTGGARDIGRAISLKLAGEGANLVVNYFGSVDHATETQSLIEAAGGRAIAVKADVTVPADIARLFEAATESFGPQVHALVNNAGGLLARKPLAETDAEFFETVMRLNVTSTLLTARAFAPLAPAGAAIVNLSSLAGRDGGGPGAAAYATAKGAVMTLTRSLAKDLGPAGVRVNAVCPGMIATFFHDTFTMPEVRARVAGATALKREGRAEEVADVVAFLLSDMASYVTGANIDVNGGLYFS